MKKVVNTSVNDTKTMIIFSYSQLVRQTFSLRNEAWTPICFWLEIVQEHETRIRTNGNMVIRFVNLKNLFDDVIKSMVKETLQELNTGGDKMQSPEAITTCLAPALHVQTTFEWSITSTTPVNHPLDDPSPWPAGRICGSQTAWLSWSSTGFDSETSKKLLWAPFKDWFASNGDCWLSRLPWLSITVFYLWHWCARKLLSKSSCSHQCELMP